MYCAVAKSLAGEGVVNVMGEERGDEVFAILLGSGYGLAWGHVGMFGCILSERLPEVY